MRKAQSICATVFLTLISALAFCQSPADSAIWNDFVSLVRSRQFPAERIRPVVPGTEQTILGFVKILGDSVSEREWSQKPEVHRVGNLVHFILPLNEGAQTVPYSFSFLVENGAWYFRHLESITIRLDQVDKFPASTFPDIPENKKTWIRQELYWSQMVNLFNYLLKDKGKEEALRFYRDGAGYFLAAKVWVPLVSPERAFILYLCWEQANLQGNPVRLESLTDREAVVRIDPIFWRLYEQSTHLRLQISREDYGRIFETIWHDRAANVGWRLEIRRSGTECLLHFTRPE
jgi:hypothetical protein